VHGWRRHRGRPSASAAAEDRLTSTVGLDILRHSISAQRASNIVCNDASEFSWFNFQSFSFCRQHVDFKTPSIRVKKQVILHVKQMQLSIALDCSHREGAQVIQCVLQWITQFYLPLLNSHTASLPIRWYSLCLGTHGQQSWVNLGIQ